MSWNLSHVFHETQLKSRIGKNDPLSHDEEVYVISAWKKARSDEKWLKRGEALARHFEGLNLTRHSVGAGSVTRIFDGVK